jgi:hypothetical protein
MISLMETSKVQISHSPTNELSKKNNKHGNACTSLLINFEKSKEIMRVVLAHVHK